MKLLDIITEWVTNNPNDNGGFLVLRDWLYDQAQKEIEEVVNRHSSIGLRLSGDQVSFCPSPGLSVTIVRSGHINHAFEYFLLDKLFNDEKP